MNAGLNQHFSYEVWENYARGTLSGLDAVPLEEHLLICCTCQDLLQQADEYIEVAKSALALAVPSEGPKEPLVADHRNRRRLSKAVGAAGKI
jgi:predicted anti-sigma-YlaC factor YlaD